MGLAMAYVSTIDYACRVNAIPNNNRYGIARKTFARKMAIRPSTFSMYLCDTERPWSSCGDAQKKFMLTLFQWLNLDLADRVGVFYEAAELLQR